MPSGYKRRVIEMRKKNKILTVLFVLMLCIALCAGCSKKAATQDVIEENTSAKTNVEEVAEPEKTDLSGESLLIYCGAGMQKPFQEIAEAFQAETGCEMNVTYANAAQIQTQIQESREGAFFIAGSVEETKPVEEFVAGSTNLVKHIPVLAVAEGNPQNITGIADLTREDIVTVIGDPESTPIGKIARKVFQDFEVSDKIHLGATTTTAPQLATVIGLGEADAAIIWKENCQAEGVEICETKDLGAYVKVVPAARLSFEADNPAADKFLEFLTSDTAQNIWMAYGYELTE